MTNMAFTLRNKIRPVSWPPCSFSEIGALVICLLLTMAQRFSESAVLCLGNTRVRDACCPLENRGPPRLSIAQVLLPCPISSALGCRTQTTFWGHAVPSLPKCCMGTACLPLQLLGSSVSRYLNQKQKPRLLSSDSSCFHLSDKESQSEGHKSLGWQEKKTSKTKNRCAK